MKNVFQICLVALLSAAAFAQSDGQVWFDLYDQYRLAPDDLMQITPEMVGEKVQQMAAKYPSLQLEVAGKSVEARPLYHISFGSGATTLLLWSQMHGDEPTATAALLAVYHFFGERSNDPLVKMLHQRLAIHSLIMLNPDGAHRFQRRNAQDIDINRDARLLQSPEGQTLKRVREELDPDYGFNLHDMGGRETVGPDKKLLNIAFMAPPFNAAEEDSPNRIRAKKLVVIMTEALNPFIAGHIARYKADYMPRAFGDAMQNWGVSTVLIESGMHEDDDPHFNVRMNFIALLKAFEAVATGDVDQADPAVYEDIPLEGTELFDVLIRDALIINGSGIAPFRGDVGINITRRKEADNIEVSALIADLGDLSVTTGLKIIEGKNLVVTPALTGRHPDPVAKERALRAGYTRIFQEPGPENAQKDLPQFTPEWIIGAEDLPEYTLIPATELNLKRSGLIKRGYTADLLIFEDPDPQTLESENIAYVLQNGEIFETGPKK